MTDTPLDVHAPSTPGFPVTHPAAAARPARRSDSPVAVTGHLHRPPVRNGMTGRDRLAIATLMGVASRHASRRDVAFDDAAADVRRAAGGRADLLGEAAGVFAAMGRADAAAWYANAAAHLCIAADGDPHVARGQVETVAARLSAPRRGVAGGPPRRPAEPERLAPSQRHKDYHLRAKPAG
ncbi:hypothetical protein GCM10011512_19650 [Tersicoccus solisilvae]|uniref:Bacterial transcriptional activator domain-containing protein n=1 Tax=Tersicoccus solisilvae TaxID=1882339 RepID=A0ABQ1P7D5_9MICC|nr:hypothetical protein [Tersicoccus solisilvae]GGC92642.1 hypothetical protein GCM10011512_19650 [Tersicoccus solisilvae]